MILLAFEDMPSPTSQRPASNWPYIVAVILMMAFGTIAILVLTALRPNQDNTALITLVIGFLAPTTLSLLAFMKSQETHLMVNSQLAAFIAAAKQVAHHEGVDEGRVQGIAEGELRRPIMKAVIPVVQLDPASDQRNRMEETANDTNKRAES